MLADFHYSDWWADPGNRINQIPENEGASLATAVADFTYEVLKYMEDNDALPDMVQLEMKLITGFYGLTEKSLARADLTAS